MTFEFKVRKISKSYVIIFMANNSGSKLKKLLSDFVNFSISSLIGLTSSFLSMEILEAVKLKFYVNSIKSV